MKNVAFRILLVEDNPDHAHLVKTTIERTKKGAYQVEWADSVEKAIEMIERDGPSLIVSDYNLPGKTGLDLLAWLNEQTKSPPFIMLTGSGDEKIAVRAMQEGAYNYVVKDEGYTQVITPVIDEALLRYLSMKEKEQLEREIREKNVALEQANRQLKKLDQLKTDFISNVSHEIRTPLNSVKESISLVKDGVVNPKEEKGARVLEIAKRNIDRLAVMVNDLLDFEKIQAGKLRLHMESCNLQVLIDEVIIGFRALAETKKIGLNFSPQENFPFVYGDAERIIQVLTNLVNNAIKFTPEDGAITITCDIIPHEAAKVTVADTGCGIPKEDLGRIFERFEQSNNTSLTKGHRGTGLGLSICQELVAMHHGKIWVESEQGKGSRFIFTIPLTVSAYDRLSPPSADALERTQK